jgi:tRNA (guanine-N7-)-methyltransferase
MSPTSADAIDRLWLTRGIDIAETGEVHVDRVALFGRVAPLVLEIGCGMGEATVAMAASDSGRDYLAVDVHTPGLGSLLAAADEQGLRNVAAACGDALVLLADGLAAGSLDAIHVFFPDPWPKARHQKRRIIRPDAVELMRDRLRPGGVLHTATDWPDYAASMLAVLTAAPGLVNTAESFAPRPPSRPTTKFEQRALAAGRPVADLIFTRAGAGGGEDGRGDQ